MTTRAQQWATFMAAMELFEEEDAETGEVLKAVAAVRACLADEEAAKVRAGFEHWAGAFDAVRAAETRDALKGCVRLYLCTPGPYQADPHNVTQGLMKATVHLIWRKVYQLEEGGWRLDLAEAVRDAITPRRERAQELLRVIYSEVASETGETTEEMMRRVCGD